ncbi:MAG: cytochrome c [Phycisphaerales bacterium]|nr:cytochrome c [Phycisphaerales bacterium]
MRNFVRGGSGLVAMLIVGAGCAALVACSSGGGRHAAAKVELPLMGDQTPRNYSGLHNVVAYHPDVFSGGVPEGAEGFETLAAMGIRTVISVDGAAPDLAEAQKHGLRYIHLPIGYNGFEDARGDELARATRDSLGDGLVYIHCHHGKHRSAGAAAAVAVAMGWMTPEQAVVRMKVSGTAPAYKGLYACAAEASVMSAAELDAVKPDFPEVCKPEGIVDLMVRLDVAMENMKEVEAAGWTPPAHHPDLVPVAEAGKVADLLRMLHEDRGAVAKREGFAAKIDESHAPAQRLEDMLAANSTDVAALSAEFKKVNSACKSCHTAHRD